MHARAPVRWGNGRGGVLAALEEGLGGVLRVFKKGRPRMAPGAG